jgi:hypothetical protein
MRPRTKQSPTAYAVGDHSSSLIANRSAAHGTGFVPFTTVIFNVDGYSFE